MTFGHNFAYIVNSFVFSLDINAMLNILQGLIKILDQKMLKAINLYLFHNDASEKNN